jgi:hypothetical protein
MIERNVHSPARRITLIADGTTQSMHSFFIQWLRMIISTGRSLRKFFLLECSFVSSKKNSASQILYEIEHGVQSISESEWPAFLYPRGTNPDVEDDQEGLFRGYLLPMVGLISIYAHILNSST